MSIQLYDTFCFNGEWIVKLRLKYLYQVIDKFIIIESKYTFSGNKKDSLFKDIYNSWFEPYADKIEWIVIDSFPETTIEWNANPIYKSLYGDNQRAWFCEHYQRDIVIHHMRKYCDTSDHKFILIVSDVDEIANWNTIMQLRHDTVYEQLKMCDMQYNPVRLQQSFHYYNFKCIHKEPWISSFVITDFLFRKDQNISLHDMRVQHLWNPYIGIFDNAGWHFSYFSDIPTIQLKIRSFSHREFDTSNINNYEYIRQCIKNAINLFDNKNSLLLINNVKEFYPEMFMEFIEELDQIQSNNIAS